MKLYRTQTKRLPWITADLIREDSRDQAAAWTGWVLGPGQSAVIADVSGDWTSPIDTRMSELGGVVHRRDKSAVEDDGWYRYPYNYYLYPYEYVPGP